MPDDTPVIPPVVPPAPQGDSPGVQARIATLQAKLDAALADAAKIAPLQARLIAQDRESAMMRHAYRNNLSEDAMDPEVIEDAGRRYERRVQTMGDKAGTFDEFLTELAKAPPVTLRSAFTPRKVDGAPPPADPFAIPAPGSEPPPKAKPGDPNSGAQPRSGPPPVAVFSEEAVRGFTPAQVQHHKAGIMAALVAEGLISPPPTPRP